MEDQASTADIAAANLPRFESELAALRLEQERLQFLRSRPDCPPDLIPVLEERMKATRAQIWTAEQSIEFLRARQGSEGPPGPGNED